VSVFAQYLERYPGDKWVDVLGLDCYHLKKYYHQNLAKLLHEMSKYAHKHNKVSALTEVSVLNLRIKDWWTQYLLKVFENKD